MLRRKRFKCGFLRSRKLEDNLQHYASCEDDDCKQRAKVLSKVLDILKGKSHVSEDA